jgi:ferredoxin
LHDKTASGDAAAREAALAAMSSVPVEATGIVNYAVAGRVLVLGGDGRAVELARQLQAPLVPTVVILGEGAGSPASDGVAVFTARRGEFRLEGHMGAFVARLSDGGRPQTFDLVVDLLEQAWFADAWPRFGYHELQADSADAASLAERLVEEHGEFEKPRYFRYDPDRCVRGRSGFTACNRCVQACPAGAITALADRVEVDPWLCQGGGVCATVCPSGAMQYAYPAVGDSIDRVRRFIEAYRDAGGRDPRLLIHEAGTGPAHEDLPGNTLPYAVEEIGSVGVEFWLSALAFGSRSVQLASSTRLTAASRTALDVQLMNANALLEGLGFPGAVGWNGDSPPYMPPIRPAAYGGMGDKREILFMALDHLVGEAPAAPAVVELPATVPLGEIRVDPGKCTLCVSCATVCPRGAVTADEDRPTLLFFESRCVQCGLCEQACPEGAIRLQARFVADRDRRTRRRVLHEEAPFECVRCGKPFATRSAIDRILAQLGGHRMFGDEAARRRLQMCGDCRVIDMMSDEGPK